MSTSVLRIPVFIVNFKSYVWGRKALELAKVVEEVAQETNVYLCVVPQIVDIALLASETSVPVFAPHIKEDLATATLVRGAAHPVLVSDRTRKVYESHVPKPEEPVSAS